MSKWETVRLGDVCTPKQWKTISSDMLLDGGYPVYGANGKIGFYNQYTHVEATVLITCRGATCGSITICEPYSYVNGNAMALDKLAASVDKNYLAFYLKKRGFYDVITGSAQPQIIRQNLISIKIPLPPFPIQQKIADILDRAGALIEQRKAQIAKLELLVKSQFVEMFGDPVKNPMGWDSGTIRDIVTEVKYGTSKPANEGGQYLYLRMNNITYDGYLDLSSLKHIDVPGNEIEKYIVRKGDVLFNRTNSKELVGKTCVFDLDEPMVIAGYIIRIRLNQRAIPAYLSATLNSEYGKQTLRSMCKAIVGQANINAQELQDIAILIPPLALQTQFATFVERVEAQKVRLRKGLGLMEMGYKALMQKCFEGEIGSPSQLR